MNPLQKILQLFTGGTSEAGANAGLDATIPAEWLLPIGPDAPSGATLEYDTEYAVLQTRLEPKADVQYGKFSSTPAPPDWREIERDCRRLMLRSKDISVLIWFARCRTRQAGALGLFQGLSALLAVLQAFADSVHPQLHIEGVPDPIVQANTLAALCDPQGLLDDVREVMVCSSTAFRLSVRDIERSLAIPRAPYSPEPAAVQRQLADLHQRHDGAVRALHACAQCVQALHSWAQTQLGEEAPVLSALQKLLNPFVPVPVQMPSEALAQGSDPFEAMHPRHLVGAGPSSTAQAHYALGLDPAFALDLPAPPPLPISNAHPNPNPSHIPSAPSAVALHPSAMPAPSPAPVPHADAPASGHGHGPSHGAAPLTAAQQREHIRQLLGQVRHWIELHEPSSPVAVLLKQADRMWGKRFSEIAHVIPPDLLQSWDRDD
jgi:type VI secretion system protein ImpA